MTNHHLWCMFHIKITYNKFLSFGQENKTWDYYDKLFGKVNELIHFPINCSYIIQWVCYQIITFLKYQVVNSKLILSHYMKRMSLSISAFVA